MSRGEESPRIAPRALDANKASVGRVLVVGGRRGMPGAPALAAVGALRAGAGLVRVGTPASIQGLVGSFRPEVITIGLPETSDGGLSREAANPVFEALRDSDVLVLGPGLGRAEETLAAARAIAARAEKPVVVDADALYAWNGNVEGLRERAATTVLTPHEGEAGRLLGVSSEHVRKDRAGTVALVAALGGCIVVLKGPGTLVGDGKRLERNATGNPLLATAGTGDVLAGAIGALLAAGGEAFEAVRAAVHAHGLAADLLAEEADRGLLATDVADALPRAIHSMLREGERRRRR